MTVSFSREDASKIAFVFEMKLWDSSIAVDAKLSTVVIDQPDQVRFMELFKINGDHPLFIRKDVKDFMSEWRITSITSVSKNDRVVLECTNSQITRLKSAPIQLKRNRDKTSGGGLMTGRYVYTVEVLFNAPPILCNFACTPGLVAFIKNAKKYNNDTRVYTLAGAFNKSNILLVDENEHRQTTLNSINERNTKYEKPNQIVISHNNQYIVLLYDNVNHVKLHRVQHTSTLGKVVTQVIEDPLVYSFQYSDTNNIMIMANAIITDTYNDTGESGHRRHASPHTRRPLSPHPRTAAAIQGLSGRDGRKNHNDRRKNHNDRHKNHNRHKDHNRHTSHNRHKGRNRHKKSQRQNTKRRRTRVNIVVKVKK